VTGGRLAPSVVTLAMWLLCTACPSPQRDQPDGPAPTPARPPSPAIVFTDIAEPAGLVHPIICGAPDKPFLIDTNGTGAAVLDFDGDGWMDLFVVHGSTMEAWRSGPTPDRLYRNLGDGRFEEVAEQVGVADRAWGAGVLAWDYDNDGDPDLYVTNFGENRLYRNDGGRFTDVAAAAGLLDPGWSNGAAAADFDRDGDLDLYVAHYFVFDISNPPRNTAQGGHMVCKWREADVCCGPIGFEPERDHLYRNDGNGRFTDISAEAGIWDNEPGHGMGVIWFDLEGDGLQDVYVANDAGPNFAYRNLGDGRFAEVGDRSGLALGDTGVPMSSMGIAAGDIDRDGSEEIFVTNYSHQYNSLYRSVGGGMYEDIVALSGLAEPSYRVLGWGTTFFDVEADGDLDLYVANGHVYPQVDVVDPTTSYRQRGQLFLNNGGGGYDEWSPAADSPLARETSSRGVARVDFDNDGDFDLLVNGLDAPPMLLRNDCERAGAWVGVRLRGTRSPRDPAGARVRVTADELVQSQTLHLGSSYMSSEDPRLLFGVGAAGEVAVEVDWPDGGSEQFGPLAVGRYHVLVEGEGRGGAGS